MRGQKSLFFVIIGLALVFVALMSIFSQFLSRWLGPPDLSATVTVMAIRGTAVSLDATEVAMAATKAAGEGRNSQAGDDRAGDEPLAGAGDLTWDGLQIDILAINDSAWPLLKAHNQFNDPPHARKQMLMIKLRVMKPEDSDDEYISVGASDFRLIGSYNQVYTDWNDESGCGVVPDKLDGVVATNLSVEGNVCFQVPVDENQFKLIYERYVGDYPAIYIDLPE